MKSNKHLENLTEKGHRDKGQNEFNETKTIYLSQSQGTKSILNDIYVLIYFVFNVCTKPHLAG